MQLQLKADGSILDIEGLTFNITMRSAIGSQSGSYVYNFTIPYTIPNAKAFGFPHRLTRFSTVQEEKDGSIIGDGITLKEGVWYAKSTSGSSISIEMYIGAGIFKNLVHEKNLPELFDVEMVYTDILDHIATQITKTFPEADHNWPPIYNPGFYGKDDDTPNPAFQGILNDWENGAIHVLSTNNNAISPQLYYGYIIKRIFAWAGYRVTGKVFEDARFKVAMAYNNFALDRLVPTKFMCEMFNKYPIYDNYVMIWDENINDPGNHYDQATGKYNVDKQGNYKIDIDLLHQPGSLPTDAEEALLEIYYGSTLIYSFQRPYAFEQHGEFEMIRSYTHEVLQADIGEDLWCKFMYLDIGGNPLECRIIEGKTIIQNIDAVENNTFQNVINYKNHVPDMDVKEFLEVFWKTAKILPFYDNKFKEVKLVFFDDLLASNQQTPFGDGILRKSLKVKSNEYKGLKFNFDYQGPDDNLNDNFIDIDQADVLGTKTRYADLPSGGQGEGDIWFIESLQCYYIWSLLVEETEEDPAVYGWKPYSDNQYPYTVDEGGEEVPFQIAPMFMRAAPTIRGENIKYRNLPCVNAKGSSIGYGLKNDFPLRIMFFYGIETGADDEFPIATTSKLSTEGNQIFPLNWKLDEIVPEFLPNYIKWLKKRLPVEFTKEITAVEIANFNFETFGNIDGALILFEEFVAKLSTSKKPLGRFKGWTK